MGTEQAKTRSTTTRRANQRIPEPNRKATLISRGIVCRTANGATAGLHAAPAG